MRTKLKSALTMAVTFLRMKLAAAVQNDIPITLSVSATAIPSVILTWGPTTNNYVYVVYRSTNSTPPYNFFVLSNDVPIPSYVDNAVVSGQSYNYLVKAVPATSLSNIVMTTLP
jgi:hypothetical protein